VCEFDFGVQEACIFPPLCRNKVFMSDSARVLRVREKLIMNPRMFYRDRSLAQT